MSESPQYFIEKKIYHGPGFSFVYEINWNVSAIRGNATATGYIVRPIFWWMIPNIMRHGNYAMGFFRMQEPYAMIVSVLTRI